MCAQRIMRAGPGADIIKGRAGRREDSRQGAFDLDLPEPAETSAERAIYRLSREVADLRMKLASSAALVRSEAPTYRAYRSAGGWVDAVDPIAQIARQFAGRLSEAKCIGRLDEAGYATADDARAVNELIAMVAEDSDRLIAALIEDAESAGLEATGAWMRMPLVECRQFEPIERDPDLDRADDIQDDKLNS